MSDDHENDLGDVRYKAMQIGTVFDRNDPQGLGRVKVAIDGLADSPSTTWALPLGAPGGGGGTKARGFKWVPPLGAEVAVFFKGGDPDRPYYLTANWGIGEMPTDAASEPPDQAPDVHCIETEIYKITIDDRPSTTKDTAPNLTITHKPSGDTITHDGATKTGPGWLIQGTAAVVVKTDGIFAVEATRVVINGRVFSPVGSQEI